MTDTATRPTNVGSRDEVKKARLTWCWDQINKARTDLGQALVNVDEADDHERACRLAVTAAAEQADDAMQIAMYALGALWVVDKNKTYLKADVARERSFTAAEKTEYMQREAAVDQDVKATVSELRARTNQLDEAKARVRSAERRLQACRHDLDAAAKQIDILTVAYGAK